MTIRGCSCGVGPQYRHTRRCSARRCSTRASKTLFKRWPIPKGYLKRGWR